MIRINSFFKKHLYQCKLVQVVEETFKKMKKLAYSLLFFLAIGMMTLESCGVDEPVMEDTTYTGDVKAIIDGNCIGCHSGNTPSADMDLTTYANVRAIAETDTLVMRINDVTMPMPPTGLLPQADRTTIENWVDGGFKE